MSLHCVAAAPLPDEYLNRSGGLITADPKTETNKLLLVNDHFEFYYKLPVLKAIYFI
jgi:hypothetical protein